VRRKPRLAGQTREPDDCFAARVLQERGRLFRIAPHFFVRLSRFDLSPPRYSWRVHVSSRLRLLAWKRRRFILHRLFPSK
jgi:hypothetical protein